jgi:hypothetical protein
MHHMRSPPVDSLLRIVGALEEGGVVSALGGSGLLAAFGLTDEVNDWDLTTDAPLDRVRAALRAYDTEWCGSSGIHADQKLMIAAERTECIIGFAFRSEAGVIRIPTVVTRSWNGAPVGSPEAWAVAYTLLGRESKAALLFERLERTGADPRVRERLLGEPLPDPLATRLRALPHRGTSSTT